MPGAARHFSSSFEMERFAISLLLVTLLFVVTSESRSRPNTVKVKKVRVVIGKNGIKVSWKPLKYRQQFVSHFNVKLTPMNEAVTEFFVPSSLFLKFFLISPGTIIRPGGRYSVVVCPVMFSSSLPRGKCSKKKRFVIPELNSVTRTTMSTVPITASTNSPIKKDVRPMSSSSSSGVVSKTGVSSSTSVSNSRYPVSSGGTVSSSGSVSSGYVSSDGGYVSSDGGSESIVIGISSSSGGDGPPMSGHLEGPTKIKVHEQHDPTEVAVTWSHTVHKSRHGQSYGFTVYYTSNKSTQDLDMWEGKQETNQYGALLKSLRPDTQYTVSVKFKPSPWLHLNANASIPVSFKTRRALDYKDMPCKLIPGSNSTLYNADRSERTTDKVQQTSCSGYCNSNAVPLVDGSAKFRYTLANCIPVAMKILGTMWEQTDGNGPTWGPLDYFKIDACACVSQEITIHAIPAQ